MINIGVLRGGPSSEYDVSLKSGATVLAHLPKEKYRPIDIFITRDGVWHVQGIEAQPAAALRRIDFAWIALHGEFGEDGTLQKMLDTHGVPYNGSGAFGSALAWNKVLSKKAYQNAGMKTPLYKTLTQEDVSDESLSELWRTFPIPVVVKPVVAGSSYGVTIVKNLHDLGQAVTEALKYGGKAMIEEYISGVEATVGVVDDWRGEKSHALMPVEIRPRKSHFFDYRSKYEVGGSDEIVPSVSFSLAEKRKLEEMAKKAHELLNQRHYSRSDFIVNPRRGIYILETNSLPGITGESLLPKELNAAGSTLGHFFDHIIGLSLGKKTK